MLAPLAVVPLPVLALRLTPAPPGRRPSAPALAVAPLPQASGRVGRGSVGGGAAGGEAGGWGGGIRSLMSEWMFVRDWPWWEA